MRLRTRTWEEAVSHWSFKGATVSLLSLYVERIEKRGWTPLTAEHGEAACRSLAGSRLGFYGLAIISNLGNNLLSPTFITQNKAKKEKQERKKGNKREMTLEDGLKRGKMDFRKIETDGRNEWQQEELRPQGRLAVLTGGGKKKKGENWMENDDDCGISHCLLFFPLLWLFPWQYLACQTLTLPHLVNQLTFEWEKMEAAYLSA